ncbi:proteasome subunit beta type-7-B-like isoform X1 [Carya illinoinensis]|uniref:proteasome subunit beta type-7-B-like isoform X1 n=1 Tax=Carya illinoinensis TaxID=32201 RepID=UPI001C71F110|nr:proteasome subunit beta type-7-B-like isoform X1 [Carya illinoinensis]XP_042965077.1 proteasome subunit beta type-7-B-like isoform X1 [Carya illinoinensis]XP_042965078.1 proteasome subunit beta type-7-B-like isoform X1 [Carya illinoinensis]
MVEEYEDMIQFQQRFLTQKRKGKLRTPIIKGSGRLLGLIIQDDIILGANTRTIEGPIITEKNCEKIHYMAPNIYCCGAGTAADTKAITGQFTTATASLPYGSRIKVVTALTLMKNHLFK